MLTHAGLILMRGMSSLATDFSVCAESYSKNCRPFTAASGALSLTCRERSSIIPVNNSKKISC